MLTVPNALVLVRLIGSGVLLWLAFRELRWVFVGLLIGLLLTDWLDGVLATRFHQRSVLGARLDSLADACMYTAVVVGMLWLAPAFVEQTRVLLWVLAASFLLSLAVGFARFGRLPSYHTMAAKAGWILVLVATVVLIAAGAHWPAQLAVIAVILTNLEATAISFVLPAWETDVASVAVAIRRRRAG